MTDSETSYSRMLAATSNHHGVLIGVDGPSVVIGIPGPNPIVPGIVVPVIFDEAMEVRDALDRAIGQATRNAVGG